MKLTWSRGSATIEVDKEDGSVNLLLPISNDVRNQSNGRRSLQNPEDVVMTTPDDGSPSVPYMPSGFPAGSWKILSALPRTDAYEAPYFLSTNAWQMTPEWSIDPAGDYGQPTGQMVRDSAFGLHFSTSSTTLGCLRFLIQDDLVNVVTLCQAEWNAGRTVSLEVSE